jgi:anthranilate phosphoribosyltransferase
VTSRGATAPDPASTEFALAEHGGWPGLLTELLGGRDLSADQSRAAMDTILSGRATAAQLIGFVVALRAKGETAEELSGMLDAVLGHAELVPLGDDLRDRAVDIVGTGGDRSHSINVSTMAALVTAGAGVPVCKHGARGASSLCGTADVLEALGVAIELSPAGVRRCVEEAGFGFCFAPRFHPAFRFAAPARKEIGIPTVFNLLGPMANPGQVRRQLIGVADADFATRMMASVRAHGSTDAWIVHGGGLDELTTTGLSTVLALRHDGSAETFTVDPVALGLAPATMDALVGGPPAHNAEVVRRVLSGEHGPHRDIVLLNAAAALVVAGAAVDLAGGLAVAAASVDEGRAGDVLERVVAVSQSAAHGDEE